MSVKDSFTAPLITALVIIFLQAVTLVGLTINTIAVKATNERVERIWSEYVPMIFLEGMTKNSNYQIEEIVATINGADKAEIARINSKYLEFQKTMIVYLQQMRGGNTGLTRSMPQEPSSQCAKK
jgi:hypothetical protein